MRIALTRLRTAISFFSPMVADPQRKQIRDELKWLHAHLGTVRDLDVAIERLKIINKQRSNGLANSRSWIAKRADSHRHLARALRSARYRRLVKDTSGWIENGPWAMKKARQATRQRALPIAAYGAGKLALWQEKLLKKSRKLRDMDTKKRHRLRLLNKKLVYSIEFLQDLVRDGGFSRQQAPLKYLRKAQKSLGQLNDDANGQSLAAALQLDGGRVFKPYHSREREKRLLQVAVTAYRKLAALKSLRD